MAAFKHDRNRLNGLGVKAVDPTAVADNGRKAANDPSPPPAPGTAPTGRARSRPGIEPKQRQLGSPRTTAARPAGKGDEVAASAWETDGGSGT